MGVSRNKAGKSQVTYREALPFIPALQGLKKTIGIRDTQPIIISLKSRVALGPDLPCLFSNFSFPILSFL